MKVDHIPNVAAQAGAHKPQPAQDAAAPASSDTGADFPAGIAAGGPAGSGNSASSPAHRAAEYLSGATATGAESSVFKNFGEVVSQFARSMLSLISEPDAPPATDPATDPVTDPITDPVTDPVTDGESAGIIAPGDGETAPTETATTSGASTEGATGGGDGGIIVPPVDDGSAAEAELLDALLDGGEGEDEASA